MDKKSCRIGVNLGGWLSQYPELSQEHFNAFIQAHDIRRIADWGFDHVRLPVDYPVVEDDRNPGAYRESGLDAIEYCLEWCRENDLNVILDLHKAPGFAFDALDESTLFESESVQKRFINLWRALADRFQGRYGDLLAFELLNEIMLPDRKPWNTLAGQVVDMIRAIDRQRLIVIGSNCYNAANELKNLAIPDDPNVLFTFHCYEPFTVTHQKAYWVKALVEYDRHVEYPGQADGLGIFLQEHPDYQFQLDKEVGKRFDKAYLQAALQPAVDFNNSTGQAAYCGEFGVYEIASIATRLSWTRDLVSLLNENGIGRAYWTYKALDFGLVDRNGEVVSRELVDIVTKK
ncbi:MAG: glycoside hydrolase family 5 protein [Anaerolineales bacterium]|nr:glycoside hydrolase family 5 protein [Anaerolineales bacterium]